MCSSNCCENKPASQKKFVKNTEPKIIIPTPQSLLYTYEEIQDMADFLMNGSNIRPKYGIICGSGMQALADMVEDPAIFEYTDIPNFPEPKGELTEGKFVVGTLKGANVMVMTGRFHAYEGFDMAKVSLPVRVMKLCGVELLFVTNAAGATNPKYAIGDIMLLHDHINMLGLVGNSPLEGPNEKRFGPRFIDMAHTYDQALIDSALAIGNSLGIQQNMHLGVYGCLGGPFFETVAEHKLLRTFGIDAVGMSTVPEVIAAKHCDMRVFAFSLITAASMEHEKFDEDDERHEQVCAVTKSRQKACCELIAHMLYQMSNNEPTILVERPPLTALAIEGNEEELAETTAEAEEVIPDTYFR